MNIVEFAIGIAIAFLGYWLGILGIGRSADRKLTFASRFVGGLSFIGGVATALIGGCIAVGFISL